MAMSKCRACGQEVSLEAMYCPKCGRPKAVQKKTSKSAWILAIMCGIAFILVVNGLGSSSSSINSTASVSNAAANTEARGEGAQSVAAPAGEQWTYEEEIDQMSGKKAMYASVTSQNTLSFGFPYRGDQYATLQLRKHPRYGKNVILSIEKGQFLCGIYGCKGSIKFDDNPPISFSADKPADYSTTTIFIKGYDRIVSKIKKSKTVYIQTTFFHEGEQVMKFDVSGFDESKF